VHELRSASDRSSRCTIDSNRKDNSTDWISSSSSSIENTVADFTIYHNPRCSKSRQTLALLQDKGVEPTIVEYLKSPPTASELKAIIERLGIKPEQLVRKSEEIYKSKYAGKTLSDAQWIAALIKNPILIERPIVVSGKGAVLGRPPENVMQLL
jgi:arsenate reductase